MLDYTAFANTLRAIDKRDDVLVTVWQGGSILVVITKQSLIAATALAATGKWFCA
jgi:hypothetical protein